MGWSTGFKNVVIRRTTHGNGSGPGPERRAQIEALRRQPAAVARSPRSWVSAASVTRVLRRADISRWRELEPPPPRALRAWCRRLAGAAAR